MVLIAGATSGRRIRGAYEAALALGLSRRVAAVLIARDALALTPGLDRTRTVGLVILPGAFVGVLLAVGSPWQAAAAQRLVLIALLLVQAVAVTAAIELIAAGRLPPQRPSSNDPGDGAPPLAMSVRSASDPRRHGGRDADGRTRTPLTRPIGQRRTNVGSTQDHRILFPASASGVCATGKSEAVPGNRVSGTAPREGP